MPHDNSPNGKHVFFIFSKEMVGLHAIFGVMKVCFELVSLF